LVSYFRANGAQLTLSHKKKPKETGNELVQPLLQLVIFEDEVAMNGVELEGLLAYRADVKQLFLRDHLSWRAIKVSG